MKITVRQFAQINDMLPDGLADMDQKERKKAEAKAYAKASAVINYLLAQKVITDTGEKIAARGGVGRSSVIYDVPEGTVSLTMVEEGAAIPEDIPYPAKEVATPDPVETAEPVEATA